MNTTPLTLVTIIAEDDLQQKLIDEVKHLGARGHTIHKARGEGMHGLRDSEWEGENIVIQILTDRPTAERIAEYVAAQYFDHAAVIVYLTAAEVVRPQKFSSAPPSKLPPPG